MAQNKIDDSQLEQVSGGVIFNAAGYEGDAQNPWEVLDNKTGEVLGQYWRREDAERIAASMGDNPYNTMELNQTQVEQLRMAHLCRQ